MKNARATRIDETERALLADGVVLCARFGPGMPLVEACRAAARGGLRVLELTLTTPGVFEAMGVLSRDPDLLVGAGTVLTPDAVRAVAAAGGKFVLSPIFTPAVLGAAEEQGLLAIPGTATPAELHAAMQHGARIVKVFPSAPLGGPAYLRFVRGPFPEARLLPTSGPTSDTIGDYMDAGAVAVGVGPEVFHPGFTMASVEAAARRVRGAMDSWRAARKT